MSTLCIFLCNRVFLLDERLLGREEPETTSSGFPAEKCPVRGVCLSVSPGPHGHAHTADHGAAAEEDQSDRDRDEPAVSPRREYRFRGPRPLLLLPQRPTCLNVRPGTSVWTRLTGSAQPRVLPAQPRVHLRLHTLWLGREGSGTSQPPRMGWVACYHCKQILTLTGFLLWEDDPTGWEG